MRTVLNGAVLSGATCGAALGALALAAGLSAPAFGQIAGPAASAGESPTLSEVVVTANRRVQSAQSVGVAVSVLSGADLLTRGVSDVDGLQYQTPSLEIVPAFGGGQPQFRLRGVGFDDYASNNASPVAVYVDEVAKPYSIQTQGLLFDIDRVEVLRGPQGTLYGRNTTGGAINFLTNRPTSTFAAGVTGEFGEYHTVKAEGYVSGPLSDTVRVRLAGGVEEGGAFQINRASGEPIGDADRYGLRAQVAWDATSRLSVLVNAQYGRDRSDGQGLYLFRPLGAQPADIDVSKTGWGASSQFAALIGIGRNTRPFRDNETKSLSIDASYDLGFARLTSISAYERFSRREYEDWDASAAADAGTYFGTQAEVVSQELRLASKGAGPFKWLGGFYYDHERLNDTFDSDFQDSLNFLARSTYGQRVETVAGFGQVEDQLTSRLNLIVGGRVEHERRNLDGYSTTTIPVIGLGVTGQDRSLDEVQGSGKLEAEYKLTPGVLGYASISRGVKSGGFSAYNTLTPSELDPFKPEALYAYEAGFKAQFLHDTLRLNGAGFHYDYRDQQVQSAIYDPVYGAVGKIVNAARAHIDGGELEATWRPTPRLEVTQAVSYKRGAFDSFLGLDIAASAAADAARYQDRQGQDEGFPHFSYNGAASYRFDLGADYTLTAQTDYSYRDAFRPVLLGPLFDIHSYWLVDAGLTLKPRNAPWTLAVFGRNILDQSYDLTRNFFLGGIDIAAPGRPATWGVRASYAF